MKHYLKKHWWLLSFSTTLKIVPAKTIAWTWDSATSTIHKVGLPLSNFTATPLKPMNFYKNLENRWLHFSFPTTVRPGPVRHAPSQDSSHQQRLTLLYHGQHNQHWSALYTGLGPQTQHVPPPILVAGTLQAAATRLPNLPWGRAGQWRTLELPTFFFFFLHLPMTLKIKVIKVGVNMRWCEHANLNKERQSFKELAEANKSKQWANGYWMKSHIQAFCPGWKTHP